jgi:Predicted transcriptional regulators
MNPESQLQQCTSEPDPLFGQCATHWLVRQLSDRWSIPVFAALQSGPKRFTELQEALHPVSHRMLGRSLKKLTQLGLISRTVVPSTPPQVRYKLTDLGKSLARPLGRLITWSQNNIAAVQKAGTKTD